MTRGCFGELGSVKNCWGYKLKVVRDNQGYDYNPYEQKDEFKKVHYYKQKDECILPKNVVVFPYKSLQKATNNFTTRIGLGGYGSFYKGILQDGATVFVKVYTGEDRGVDFFSLMKTMSRIRHRNVIECIGCCFEGDHRIVVYEFVGEYNLGQLFDSKEKCLELSWPMRATICLGVARGLEYLHNGIIPRVVHRDIKPYNVVLDNKFNPKIVDFDISHTIEDDLSDCSSRAAGTIGYLDPEYFLTGRFSEKSDVYSFGILLLEVITGRKSATFPRESGDLVDWVWELREKDRITEVVDPTLSQFPEDELARFISVALFCVQISANRRPSMTDVLLMLSANYDFSMKVLERPNVSQWSNTYAEVDSPVSDLRSGEFEITAATSDRVSSMHLYEKGQESIQAGESFKRPLIDAVAETKDQMIRRDEIEIESDLDTYSSEAELMEMSNDLETELYSLIDQKASVIVSESGPSDKTAVAPEMMSTSKSDILVKKGALQAAEQVGRPDVDMGVTATMAGPSLETSVNPEIMASMSAQTRTYTYSEAVEGLSFQAEAGEKNEVLSLPKVTTDRPIHSTVEKIVEALRDDKSRVICLHGIAGSGKTAVLETLLHHPAMKYLFDLVVYVTVPRLAHRQKIQNEIIQQLSLDVQYCKAEDEIAALIHHALTGREVLLLLDDFWEVINLHEVGIPNPAPGKRFWLVLSARSPVKCDVIVERNIEMEVLSTAEAWELFHYQVGDTVDSPQIEPYARAIVEECHGLPLIVSAVGSALRSESSVLEWKLALTNFQSFKRSTTENQYPLSAQIKYCYDRLKTHDVKTCFLYCALFPREKEIDISLLVDCLVHEGLLGQRTVAAYRKGHDIVKHLVKSSLLEASDNSSVVKMHNVIRDSALAILSSSIEGYEVLASSNLSKRFGKSGSATKLVDRQDSSSILTSHIDKYLTKVGSQVKELPSLEEWEQATMIFLMDNGLSTLPSNPSCPNLIALCLQRNQCLRVIPESFFDSMCSLRFLNLSKTRIKALPDSVSNLVNLKVLILHDCGRLLMLPSSIGLLKSLQVLNLQGTELSHLPDTIGELASLKQLRVSFYGSINHREYHKLPAKLIPDGIISSLELRELGIFVHPGDKRWTLSALDVIKEVKNLKLSALFFHFPEVEHLEFFLDKNQSWINGYLTMFNFIVGCDFKRIISQDIYGEEFMYSEEERCLRFVNGENIPDAVVEIIKRITSFYLDHHLNISDLSEFGIYRMNDLKLCIIRDCPELQAIVYVKEHMRPVFALLEFLCINHLWNLKRIWAGPVAMGSLARLRYLSIHVCPKLRYVLTCSMVEVLVNLEELVIEDCESLESIVTKDEKVMNDDITNQAKNTSVRLPVLSSLKQLKLHYLPKLCGIWVGTWPPLEYISFYDCPKLKTLHMDSNDASNIKEIAADKAWWDTLDWDDSEVPRRLEEHVFQTHIKNL